MTETVPGRSAGSKPINLSQLQDELSAAGVAVSGLGMQDDLIYTYAQDGTPSDFPADQTAIVDQAIADHVALRPKTSEEYSAEFQDPNTSAARKQEIRDITAGLLPPEEVPM